MTFKSVVLAIGFAAPDPATWAGSDETIAVSEALSDDYCGSDGVRFHRRSWAFNSAKEHDRGAYVAVVIQLRRP